MNSNRICFEMEDLVKSLLLINGNKTLCSYFFFPNELLLLQVLYEGRPVLRLGEIPRQHGVVEAFLKVTITTRPKV